MNIFNALNLKGNKVSNMVIDSTFDSTAIAGAIKYVEGSGGDPGTLQYYDGTQWTTVGGGGGSTYNVNGYFKFKAGTNATGTTWTATAAVDASNATQIQIDYDSSKGTLKFSDNGSSSDYVSVNLPTAATIAPNYMQIGSFTIDSTHPGQDKVAPYTINITHTLGTMDVQVSLYVEAVEESKQVYRKVLCEVHPTSTTNVRLILDSTTSSDCYGTYHFILIGNGAAEVIPTASISLSGATPPAQQGNNPIEG